MKLLAALTLPLYALDQATKWWMAAHFALPPTATNLERFPDVVARTAHLPEFQTVVSGFFELVHWSNTGAAFSIGQGRNWLFVVLSAVALLGIGWASLRGHFVDRLSRIGAALLTAGILGNLTDRILRGYVVDFLVFDLHVRFADPWPAFNVADSCICIAVGLFLIASFRESRAAAVTPAG